jgi:hypothetical protein
MHTLKYIHQRRYTSLPAQSLGSVRDISIISKALYGLQSSGARWHDRFDDRIREIGFFPCKAEPDIWLDEEEG